MIKNKTGDALLDRWNDSLAKVLIPNDVLLSLYVVIGTFGNIVVLVVYMCKMKVKRDDRFFIPALAITDAIACITGGIFAFIWNMLPVKFTHEFACEVLWFSSQIATITSGLFLIIIAIQRYLKVCKPNSIFPQKWKYISIVLCILFSCGFSIPIFFYYGKVEVVNPSLNITGYWCGQKRQNLEQVIFYDITIVSISVIASTVLVVLYILIGRQIYCKFITFQRRIKGGKYVPTRSESVELDEIQPVSQRQKTGSRANSLDDLVESDTYRRKIKRGSEDILDQGRFFTIGQHFKTHRYSYMFMTITALFIVAYAPRVTIMLLETLYPDFWARPSSEIAGFLFLYRMYILNHALNPFIYTFFDTRFRKELWNVLCCCRKRTIESTHF